MSDEFDKEAERQKLRERFEQEQNERESTQVMSDLLLKGATMTNKHCNECGDPVFRQNGQEFCPSCHGQGQHGEAQAAAAEEQEASGGQAQSQQGQAQPAAQNRQPQQQPQAPATQQTNARQQRTQQAKSPQQPEPDADGSAGATEASPTDSASEPAGTAPQADGLAGARNRLAAAIETHADRAIETTDPRDATEHLEAARTAAEALAALRRQD